MIYTWALMNVLDLKRSGDCRSTPSSGIWWREEREFTVGMTNCNNVSSCHDVVVEFSSLGPIQLPTNSSPTLLVTQGECVTPK